MVGVSGGALVLAACGAAPTAPGSDPNANAPGSSSGGTTTIRWANRFTSEVTQEVIPLMVAAFEAQYPEIKVEYENPGVGEGYEEALLAQIAAGDPPDVMICNTTPAEYAARGSLTDISDKMSSASVAKPEAFFTGPLASCQWQGRTYGLPSSAGAGAIFTNVAKFEEKGIPTDRDSFPKTWDELRALSREFTVIEGGNVVQAGFIPFIGNSWLYPVWSALNGGKIYDAASNTYMLDSDNNVEWLNYWLSWLDEEYGGNLEALNTAGTWADAYDDGMFWAGNLASVHSGSWVVTDAQIPFAFESVKFPSGPSGSGASLTGFYPNWWAIPTGAKNVDEAFLFIEFVATTGWQTWYKFIMDTPSWRDFPPDVLTDRLVETVGEERARDYNNFFADYLNEAIPMWDSPIELFAQETIGNSISEVLNKVKDARTALGEAQQLCQTRLAEVSTA
jgi:multiple sugar transport system substrate-binding protein